MKTLLVALLLLALSTPAFGDYHRRVDPGYANRHGTARTLSQNHIVGGRAVTSDYYRPYRHRSYGHGSRYRDRGDTTVIIIERDRGYGRRWR